MNHEIGLRCRCCHYYAPALVYSGTEGLFSGYIVCERCRHHLFPYRFFHRLSTWWFIRNYLRNEG